MDLRAFAVVAIVSAGVVTPAAPAAVAPSTAAGSRATATTIRRDGAELRFQRQPGGTTRTAVGAKAASAPARFDLDGDGLDEIVSGAFVINPAEATGGYAVVVEYSSRPYRDYLTPPVSSPTSPNIGDPMVAGDFNADGYADLAISNQGEFVPGTDGAFAGAVWVFYGSPTGLNPTNPQHLNQDAPGIPDTMEPYDFFGAGLGTGDLNGDGYDDLAVGAPGEDLAGIVSAGLVTVLFGSPTGITTAGVSTLTQNSPGVPDDDEANDFFGNGLAIGDVTGDGYADLAVGTPGQGNASFGAESGMLTLVRGAPTGLSSTGVTALIGHKDVTNEVSELGYQIRIADFDGDRRGDVVVSAANNNPGGMVVYFPGTPAGLTKAGVRVIGQDTAGVPGTPGDSDSFGYGFATGDVTGDGRADLLVGAASKDIGSIADAGAVYLMPGTAAGLTGAGTRMLTQDALTIRRYGRPVGGEKPDPYDYFGKSVSILDLDGSGGLDMLVGSDLEDLDGVSATGILVTIQRRAIPTSRGVPATVLVPGRWWSGLSFPDRTVRVRTIGRTLLSA
jgi:hypothetical protein